MYLQKLKTDAYISMVKSPKFSAHSRLLSFKYAFEGFRHFFYTEHNAWLHAFATVMIIGVSFAVGISASEWIAIVFSIALVWITEMLNTAVEKSMDHLSPASHPQVKLIKDVAAAAVLTAAVAACIVAFIIFIPKLL